MTPLPDPAAGSPLATLRQLKEMLDAGTITPQEFEALKQRLVFGSEGDLPAPTAEAAPPVLPYLDSPAALTPEATPLLTPEPDWLAAPAPALLTASPEEQPDHEDVAGEERRNPLNLVFAIGGLLLFLGVVAYLTLGRPATPDEHLTSTTQTAADTIRTAPEVGPQAEQLTLPPAAPPETLRVAPATAPSAVPTPSTQPDSAAATVPAAAAPKPAPAAKPVPKPVAAPAPAPAPAADTAASRP